MEEIRTVVDAAKIGSQRKMRGTMRSCFLLKTSPSMTQLRRLYSHHHFGFVVFNSFWTISLDNQIFVDSTEQIILKGSRIELVVPKTLEQFKLARQKSDNTISSGLISRLSGFSIPI